MYVLLLPDYMINRLQSVLRSAARLVLQLPKRSHALERMQAELHWLVYPHRLYYKVGVISYKCLHGLAPPYLSTRLIKVSDVDGRSHLRSASDGQLVIPKSKTKTIGVRGFHISGPTFWNFLPGQLRDNDLTLRTFREQLKTVLFRGCSWEESTARAFAMLITLRGVLKCLINNNNNNNCCCRGLLLSEHLCSSWLIHLLEMDIWTIVKVHADAKNLLQFLRILGKF